MRVAQVILWNFAPHRIIEIGPVTTRLFPVSGLNKRSIEVPTAIAREIFLCELMKEAV